MYPKAEGGLVKAPRRAALSAVLLKCFRVVKRKYVNVCAYQLDYSYVFGINIRYD